VVLLVDVSGSMSEPEARGEGNLSKLERTKEAIRWLVNDMKEESRIALYERCGVLEGRLDACTVD